MKVPKPIILPDISEIKDPATKEALEQFSNLIDELHRYNYENARLSVITFPNGDTTPDVQDGMVFKTANAGATTITTFDNGFVGQKITIILGDANTTIADTDNIILKSAYTSLTNDSIRFSYDGTNWREISRTVDAANIHTQNTDQFLDEGGGNELSSSSGSLAGWTVAAAKLSAGGGVNYIGLEPGVGIQLGSETFANAPFSVTKAGVLKAVSGIIGGWDIGVSTIESANDKVKLDDLNDLIEVYDDSNNVRVELGLLPTIIELDYMEYSSDVLAQAAYVSSQPIIELDFMEYATDGVAQTAYVTSQPIIELDYMEYATDVLAQAAYVSSDAGSYSSDLIPTMTSNTAPSGVASASFEHSAVYAAWKAMDDDNTSYDGWYTEVALDPAHWLQYQFTSGKVIQRYTIASRNHAVIRYPKDWTLQGSNNGSDWDILDTQSGQTFTQAEKKTYSFSNQTSYAYYRLYITKTHDPAYGENAGCSIGEWELIEFAVHLQSYSEDTIKQQGTYSLKGMAKATDSLNETLTRTVDPVIDLSGKTKIEFYAYASRTGSNFKVGFHDAGGVTTEHTVNISSAGAWEKQTVDISGVADGDKDAINSIIVTIIEASAENEIYIDNIATPLILLAYSEDTIKEQGDYSLKIFAEQTDSITETLTRTVDPVIDLSGISTIKFKARGSRTGSNFKIGIHDAGGTTTEHTVNIAEVDTWQEETIDMSGVADGNKDAIDSIIFTILNADEDNTIYLDDLASPLILLAYSEDTIKQQGSYSLKGIAKQTSSLNETLTRTIDPTLDLSGQNKWIFYIYSSRTGDNIKVGFHNSGGPTTEITPDVTSAGAWQKVEVDISGVSDANKDAIDSIITTPVNADSDNTFYLDNLFSTSKI